MWHCQTTYPPSIRSAALQDANADSPKKGRTELPPPGGGTEGGRDLAEVPIIVMTALSMPGDHERCLAVGANAYLSKPVNWKKLIGMIKSQLKQAGRNQRS